MFKRWTQLIGQPELLDDPRFADDRLRGENGEILSDLMSRWCADKTQAEALSALETARIPASPVNSPRQVLEDDTVKAADVIRWMDYPGAPKQVPIFATPVSLSRTPPEIHTRPPLAGEHTDEILAGLGLDAGKVADLRSRKIV
jgi:crotonobetainyl-CoA:carnitine CoA-transferase CaiB-like acyl-CoA transferase